MMWKEKKKRKGRSQENNVSNIKPERE